MQVELKGVADGAVNLKRLAAGELGGLRGSDLGHGDVNPAIRRGLVQAPGCPVDQRGCEPELEERIDQVVLHPLAKHALKVRRVALGPVV